MAAIALRFLAVFALVFGISLPAAAQEGPTMVVSLNSAEVFSSQAAFEFARQIQQNGGAVVVYLNVDAVRLASARTPQAAGAVTGKSSHQLIAEIVAGGGRVFVCTVCVQQAGLSMRDRVEGVELGGQALREILMAPATRIMSF